MEWQMTDFLNINEALNDEIDDGISSQDSEKEDLSNQLHILDQNFRSLSTIQQKPKKVPKITEVEFNEMIKKT